MLEKQRLKNRKKKSPIFLILDKMFDALYPKQNW